MGLLSVCIVFLSACHGAMPASGSVYFSEASSQQIDLPDFPDTKEGYWQVLDDQLDRVSFAAWSSGESAVDLGALPVGWYRIEFLDRQSRLLAYTTAAVLEKLSSPPSAETPVALDAAMSWVPPTDPDAWDYCARLARYAGVRMVRDRLRWQDMQPEPGPFVSDTKYYQTNTIQQGHHLQILQVFHQTPAWIWEKDASRGRMPVDLRDTWRFCQDIAAHFQGRVHVWQPWNEGNSANFGGHTIDELCSHQKAAFLGFRAGDPDAVVSWAPLGGINSEGLCRGIIKNGVSPYFDVYAMHSYDWPHDYPKLRQWALKAASGKPLWVTESDRGMESDPDSPHGDFTHEDEKRKAEFIVQSIASSLAAGATRHFHFILPHYLEQNDTVQFGLLRHDLTPRMGYVALAASGRLLADARYLGRIPDTENPDVYIFAFHARPHGVPCDVLVAWTEGRLDWPERGNAKADVPPLAALPVTAVFDYLGRPVDKGHMLPLTGAPRFLVLPAGTADTLPLEPPPPQGKVDATPLSTVVLQFHAPDIPIRGRVRDWAHEHDRIFGPGDHEAVLRAYNFGDERVTGSIRTEDLPEGWRCEPSSWTVSVEPMARYEQTVHLHVPEPGPSEEEGAWLQFKGDFGHAGKTRLAVRVLP